MRRDLAPWIGGQGRPQRSVRAEPLDPPTPRFAELHARFLIACQLRDVEAVMRIVQQMRSTPEGEWLAPVLVASVLKQLSDQAAATRADA